MIKCSFDCLLGINYVFSEPQNPIFQKQIIYSAPIQCFVICVLIFDSTKGELTSTVDGKPVQAVEAISNEYMEFVPEGIVINALGCALVALAILVPCVVKFDPFRKGLDTEGEIAGDEEEEEEDA